MVGYIVLALCAGVIIGFFLAGLVIASSIEDDEVYQQGWEDGYSCGKGSHESR